MPIPPFIHQAWIPPTEAFTDLPDKVMGDTRRWKATHPSFTHKIWSLAELKQLCGAPPFVNSSPVHKYIWPAIEACRFPAMQADVARLAILYELGGWWVDLKLVPKTSFLEGLSTFESVIVEHQATENLPDPAKHGVVQNCFIGSASKSELILKALEMAVMNIVQRRVGSVWDLTGPYILQQAVKQLHPSLFSQVSNKVCLLRRDEFFEVLVGFGWGSYNGVANKLHWTNRSRTEPMYVTV